ncbi:MAG: hypothetical protein MJZ20_01580 [Bacteroidaceae bacterium]|nr:hypothetical protein [Bacteroidaceae bacterium]
MSEGTITIISVILGTGVVNTIVTAIINYFTRKRESNSAVNKASRLLMKTQLRDLCQRYIDQGWIYADELDDIISMHSIYHNDLKGNGFLDVMMAKVKALPVKGVGVH